MFYYIYAFLVLIVVGSWVMFYRKKQIFAIILSAVPTIISLLFFWWYVKENVFSACATGISDGCMNETGMIGVMSLFFIFLSIVLILLSFIFNKLKKINI